MSRRILTLAVAAFLGAAVTAYGQERGPGGRSEVAAFPGGGLFFMQSGNKEEPKFFDYAVGGSFTFNFNKWVGAEGELGGGVGRKQNLNFENLTLSNQKTPHMLGYTGNLVVNPWSNNHAWVPYATGGLGGLTMFNTNDVVNLGVRTNETYLTGNVGGGIKWFSNSHFGVRGDYRFMAVRNKTTAPLFFGQTQNRYGHRVYGGLVFTY